MKPTSHAQCSTLLVFCLFLFIFTYNSFTNKRLIFHTSEFFYPLLKPSRISEAEGPTNLSHIVFGLIGSEKAWHYRKGYIESWWRPNITRGLLFLDKSPSGPWSETSPSYRVSDDLTKLLNKTEIRAQRMVHGIMEVLREIGDEEFRWLVMGDDDSIFFVDNIVDVVGKYEHGKYYYVGGHSEFILSNYRFSFNQAFGGGGIILSYPLAKALARDIEGCLRRYVYLNSADNTTRACIADIGVNLTPNQGNHQLDFNGDISALLSAHPLSPLVSLHHFDMLDPIFPAKDRFESTRHLMMAAKADESRMLQQTICYERQKKWSFSVSWGYSAQIYERVMPRSYLQTPIETFKPWIESPNPPTYMFNTRHPSSDPCEAPHAFFLESVRRYSDQILTTYSRAWPRALPPCANNSADFVQTIQVFSPPTKRTQMDRCECCNIIGVGDVKAEIRFRQCMADEIIA